MTTRPSSPPAGSPCPCGRRSPLGAALTFGSCCAPYLPAPGSAQPPTAAPDAEALMRSRYTAFALGEVDHLWATWHPDHRPTRLELDDAVTWTGLDVLDRRADGDLAEVEFVAHYRDEVGRAGVLHERSRFVRRQGRWYYTDGTVR